MMLEWKVYDPKNKPRGTCLVYLEESTLDTHLAIACFKGCLTTVGSFFEFDMPKILLYCEAEGLEESGMKAFTEFSLQKVQNKIQELKEGL